VALFELNGKRTKEKREMFKYGWRKENRVHPVNAYVGLTGQALGFSLLVRNAKCTYPLFGSAENSSYVRMPPAGRLMFESLIPII